MTNTIDNLLALAGLSLALGTEERVTLHPDGETRESVATHSHMLGMIACTVAVEHNDKQGIAEAGWPARRRFSGRFSVGLVAQFAMVHDVPEVAEHGPGDVDTYATTDPEALAEKDAAEDAAIARLAQDHPGWLGPLVTRYREQKEPEARLVRYLDKTLPKMTLVLSECAQWDSYGMAGDALAYFREFVERQGADLAAQYPELVAVVGPIYEAMNARVEEAWANR